MQSSGQEQRGFNTRVQLKTKQRIGLVHAGWGAKRSGGGGKAAAAMRARHDTRTTIYVRRRTACKTAN
jgi:copper oxidase (laccase) domain-containing protein